MSSFTTDLNVQNVDALHWKVLAPFNYNLDTVDSSFMVDVPVDFVTDFASIPRILWTILPPWGTYGKAAVIHDYMYTVHHYSHFAADGTETLIDLTRKQADDIFLQAMGVLGVNKITKYAMYFAVRVFGNTPWND